MLVYTIWDLIGIVILMIPVVVFVFCIILYKVSCFFADHNKNDDKNEEESR